MPWSILYYMSFRFQRASSTVLNIYCRLSNNWLVSKFLSFFLNIISSEKKVFNSKSYMWKWLVSFYRRSWSFCYEERSSHVRNKLIVMSLGQWFDVVFFLRGHFGTQLIVWVIALIFDRLLIVTDFRVKMLLPRFVAQRKRSPMKGK